MRVSTPAAVDPEVAAATAAAHLDDFFKYSPYVGDDWSRHGTDNPLIHVVGIPVRGDSGVATGKYFVELGFSHYDTWPPRLTFVERDPDGRWVRSRIGAASYPFFYNSPGAPVDPTKQAPFAFALHDAYTFTDDQSVDQLVCFSYSFGYYTSNHTPTEDQKWVAGRDRLDASLNRLFKVLNSSAYAGPSKAAA